MLWINTNYIHSASTFCSNLYYILTSWSNIFSAEKRILSLTNVLPQKVLPSKFWKDQFLALLVNTFFFRFIFGEEVTGIVVYPTASKNSFYLVDLDCHITDEYYMCWLATYSKLCKIRPWASVAFFYYSNIYYAFHLEVMMVWGHFVIRQNLEYMTLSYYKMPPNHHHLVWSDILKK